MSNVKKIVICILAISLVVLAITTNVFATAGDLFGALEGNNTNNTMNNIEVKDNTNTNTNTNVNVNTNTNVKENTNASNAEEHADAGVDYSIVFIIAVCGISAIYAYKKIRDYNV